MKEFKLLLGVFNGIWGYLFGSFDIMIKTLLVFIVIDYITGIFVAVTNKKISSSLGFKGILGKITIFCLIALATSLDNILHTNAIRLLVISFYIANEGISILENTAKLNVPYPKKLKDVLEELKAKDN